MPARSPNVQGMRRTPKGHGAGVSADAIWLVTVPGSLTSILNDAFGAGATTVEFPSGTFEADGPITIPSDRPVSLVPTPGALTTLIGTFVMNGGSGLTVQDMTVISASSDGVLTADDTIAEEANVRLINVTLKNPNLQGTVLSVPEWTNVLTSECTIESASTNSPPLILGSTNHSKLVATGLMNISSSADSGVAIQVNNGQCEILGSAANWDINGSVEFIGDHSIGGTEPGKYLFGDTRMRLVASSASTLGAIKFDETPDESHAPSNAFISFDSIDLEVTGDFSTGIRAVIDGLPVDNTDNEELDVDHNITLRVGRWTQNLITDSAAAGHGVAQSEDDLDTNWTINETNLFTTAADPDLRGIHRSRLN